MLIIDNAMGAHQDFWQISNLALWTPAAKPINWLQASNSLKKERTESKKKKAFIPQN